MLPALALLMKTNELTAPKKAAKELQMDVTSARISLNVVPTLLGPAPAAPGTRRSKKSGSAGSCRGLIRTRSARFFRQMRWVGNSFSFRYNLSAHFVRTWALSENVWNAAAIQAAEERDCLLKFC